MALRQTGHYDRGVHDDDAKPVSAVGRICVFSGSSDGASPEYRQSAVQLGELLAGRGIGLVYGGAAVGLMGAVADAAAAAGGEVIGVIPQALVDREVAHTGLEDLRIVGSMHERKALMAELSDAFIALPGGIGTLEELFEVWTWTQLGTHAKACGVLNTLGFYDGLLGFLDHVAAEAFLKPVHRGMLLSSDSPADLVDHLLTYRVPTETKWIGRDER
jgi:uncharacterized protein (TIGR00730 family)